MVKNMKVYLYILGACSNPDKIPENCVPFKIDEELIFFGPCKRRLREKFYKDSKELLRAQGERDVSEKGLYLVGFNASNPQKRRKIVWCGKVTRVMTFERAFHLMISNPRFKDLLERRDSQLHLEPVYDGGDLKGYKLRSNFHIRKKEWVRDLTSKERDHRMEITRKSLILKNPEERWELLNRDACFFCENIFFAEEQGIEIKSGILDILQEEDPSADEYHIFGKGRYFTGRWKKLEGDRAERFVKEIKKRTSLST